MRLLGYAPTELAGNELQVLRIVEKFREADEVMMRRSMAVSLTFIQNICNSLVDRGYLTETAGGYKLTSDALKVLKPYATPGNAIGPGRRAAAVYPRLPGM